MFNFLFKFHVRLLLAVVLGCLMTFVIVKASKRWSPEAREKEFQSALAECERLAEIHGDNWRAATAIDDTCALVFEEYSQRINEEKKQQAIDEAAKSGIKDGAAPEPPDTE